jgi:hypothetical protein
MPIVSGTLEAAGEATFSPVGGPIRAGSFFASTFAQAVWEAYLASSVYAIEGEATALFSGSGAVVLLAEGAFTYQPLPLSTFDGTIRRDPPISVRHSLGQPSVMNCRVIGIEPVNGQEVTIDFGDLLFAGTITNVKQVTEDGRDNVAWDVQAVDHLWRLNARFPVACFNKVSASLVIAQLFADWAPDFGTANVEGGLPEITRELDGTTSMLSVLQSIAEEIGATLKANNGFDPFFYITSVEAQPDQLNNTTNQTLLHSPELTSDEEFTQVGNRVLVYGAEMTVAEDTQPGSTTISVNDIALVEGTSGLLATGCQRFGYGGAGISKTIPPRANGPGTFRAVLERDAFARASNGPVKTPCAYKISFVKDGAESALGSEVRGDSSEAYFVNPVGQNGAPLSTAPGGALPQGVQMKWVVSPFTASGADAFPGQGGGATVAILTGSDTKAEIGLNFCGDGRFVGWHIWRTKGNPGPGDFGPGGVPLLFLVGTVSGSPGDVTTFFDTQPDSALVQAAPVNALGIQLDLNTTGGNVLLENIPLQDGSTRKIYRALMNYFTGQLGTYVQIASLDEIETTYRDTTTSPSIWEWGLGLVSDPPSGTQAPGDLPPIFRALITGVSGITEFIPKGATIRLFLAKDDLAAQVALAARMGGDGVREFTVTDTLLSTNAGMDQRATAELLLRATPRITVAYATLDPKSIVGTYVDINMTRPPLVANLKIQEVTVKQINESDDLVAIYEVSASSNKFTINDLLRRVVIK